VEKVLDDGSYLVGFILIQEKGGAKICRGVIEYTIDSGQGKHSYRLISSLLDATLFQLYC